MRNCRELSAAAIVGMAAVAGHVFAADPAGAPGGTTAPPGPSQQPQQESLPQSDQDRIVGKVVQIDREQGKVALSTDEGVLVVQASPQEVQTINVGDTVSVPRSAAGPPSASPRE